MQSAHAPLAQSGDERLDQPPAPALTLKFGQEIDVQVGGILGAVGL